MTGHLNNKLQNLMTETLLFDNNKVKNALELNTASANASNFA
jgi:hypothetical protein